MKKAYIKPVAQECAVIVDGIIATSQVRISVGGDVENATTDAGRNRGEWGNLWN